MTTPGPVQDLRFKWRLLPVEEFIKEPDGPIEVREWRGLVFARAGYVGVAITQPGFGRSEGPSDWVGPTTIKTLQQGLSVKSGLTASDFQKM